jgi:hypothetical protein
MGKISRGILGGFSGKVGNIIGATWKGIDYIRIVATNVTNPKTPAQESQRSKFVTVLRFLQPLVGFLRIGFRLYANRMTQFNNAMSYNFHNAIIGVFPNYSIDPAEALVTRGNLTGVESVSAMVETGMLEVSWTDNSGNGSAKATDRALILAYDPDLKEAVYLTEGVIRSSESATLALPESLLGSQLHVYLGFISQDGTAVSNSIHTVA